VSEYRWDETPPPSPGEDPEDPREHWSRRLKQARDTPPDGIRLGTNRGTRLPVYITPSQLRTHMHVVGATNVGKSYFLEGAMKQLIMGGHGLCLVDPHGDLYHRMLDFCAYMNIEEPALDLERRVIPFDIGNTRQLMGFNPVQRNARVMTYQVVALMEAIRKCWSAESFDQTPRLARWLFNTGYAVVDSHATLLQALEMVDPKPNRFRDGLIRQIKDPQIKSEWEWISRQKDERREEKLESTFNKIREFVQHDILKLVVGQYTNTLDFPDVLAGRKILLVNLAKQNVISEDNQRLLGTLLVNELLTAAFARPAGERSPFYLVLDEFQHFVTKDMCEILDGGRKFGLHLILAHQHLNQLKIKDPEVYYSVLTNARIKAVFGGLIDDDLNVLAKELYTGEFDPDEVKDELWQTKYRPVETTRLVVSESDSHSDSSSYGSVTHESLATGNVYIPGSTFLSPNLAMVSSTASAATGTSSADTSADTHSETRSLVPWYEYHEYKELSQRTFRSLEEQVYLKKAQMKRQPGQHAAILIPDANVQLVKTPTLRDLPLNDRDRSEFIQVCMENARCFKGPREATREIDAMKEKLLDEANRIIDVAPSSRRTKRMLEFSEPPPPDFLEKKKK
jgi:hypothetical protein